MSGSHTTECRGSYVQTTGYSSLPRYPATCASPSGRGGYTVRSIILKGTRCASFMRTLKKALSAFASEDLCEWDVHLQAVAFARNATPHTSTNHSPFFLVHGREAILPSHRHLDAPRLDAPSRGWHARLWPSRVHVHQAHVQETRRQKRFLEEPGAILPKGTIVAVKLTPADLQASLHEASTEVFGPVGHSRVFGERYDLPATRTGHGCGATGSTE